MTLGEQIRFWRTGRGMTQQQLAQRAGMHTIQISNLERDTTRPNLSTIHQIAEALGARAIVSIVQKEGETPEITRWY